jgi:DedD protein
MAESQDVNTLKRRGRRRLVGAIALVLLAVIVLPMVFDSEPEPGLPPVSVRIPSEDDAGFTPKVTPKAPPAPVPSPAAPVEPPRPEAPKPEAKVAEKPAPEKASDPEAERKRAEAALAGGEQYVVQVGAYTDPGGVVQKLKAAKLPYYTEPLATAKGTVTRVRAGPFASREAAEKAQERIRSLGLKPGNVVAKS